MKTIFAAIVILLCGFPCRAQKSISAEEVQFAYKLMRATPEFKSMKASADSANALVDKNNNMPWELDVKMLKIDPTAPEDDNLFDAEAKLGLAIGMQLQVCQFRYDKRKKQLVYIKLWPRKSYDFR